MRPIAIQQSITHCRRARSDETKRLDSAARTVPAFWTLNTLEARIVPLARLVSERCTVFPGKFGYPALAATAVGG